MGYRRESTNPEQVVQRTRDNSCTNNRKKGCVGCFVGDTFDGGKRDVTHLFRFIQLRITYLRTH